QALHSARERRAAVRFDDQVQVISQHAELHDPHSESPARGFEGAADGGESPRAAQGRPTCLHPQCPVGWRQPPEPRPCVVRHERLFALRLAPGSLSLPAPLRKFEQQLLHLVSGYIAFAQRTQAYLRTRWVLLERAPDGLDFLQEHWMLEN